MKSGHGLILPIMCVELDARFEAIYSECEALSDYGVAPRYPNEMHIQEHHMKNALKHAHTIKGFAPLQAVRRKLEQSAK